jgi:acetyltransferase-like isoleucine patch superfamily enzyme
MSLILYAIALLDRVSQRRYMQVLVAFLRRFGVQFDGMPLWISPRVYFDRSGGITLGDRCVISHDVRLLTHDFSLDRVAEERTGQTTDELSRHARVEVGAFAFIGMGATILPGVTIGRSSIVGAGSVVTKSVPPYTVVAGNPARVISSTDAYWDKSSIEFTRNPRRR